MFVAGFLLRYPVVFRRRGFVDSRGSKWYGMVFVGPSPPTSPLLPAQPSLCVTLLRLVYIRIIKHLHTVKGALLYSITSSLFTLKFTLVISNRRVTTNYTSFWRCFYQSRADEVLVTNCHPTRLRIPEDSNIYAHVHEKLQYHRRKYLLNKWKIHSFPLFIPVHHKGGCGAYVNWSRCNEINY